MMGTVQQPNEALWRCRVCGLLLEEPPWGHDGRSPTFDFCPCCGVEFGYGDFTPKAIQNWRQEWIAKGARWREPDRKPHDWALERQLLDVPRDIEPRAQAVNQLTLLELRRVLDTYLAGDQPFSAIRRFVYSYYEAEDAAVLDASLAAIFPILAPYVADEEARGDPDRHRRIRRLRGLLGEDTALAERTVFALEYERIRDLVRRFEGNLIPREVFEGEIRKLSPGSFDLRRVAWWAMIHRGEDEPDSKKLGGP